MNLHALISAITLLAVAANPVVASWRPCCCAQRPIAVKSCCQKAAQARAVAATNEACCERHQTGTTVSRESAACCCVKDVTPAAPVREIATASSLQKAPLDLAVLPAVANVRHEPVSLRRPDTSEFVLAGPDLLALYCVWLK